MTGQQAAPPDEDSRMHPTARVWVAGHRGLAGSAVLRALAQAGYRNLLTRTHAELDLADAHATEDFFRAERPEYVILAAAKVGGIHANDTYPAQFIRDNLAIQTNVIHLAWRYGVKRLLFLGSSCIYPRDCPQPMREDYLLTGPLEPTDRPYAIAKIAGIEMCWSYNRQYRTRFLCAMPTNLYGPGDNYDLGTSHVLPALIRKFHEAKRAGAPEVVVWGSGTPRREFLYSDDLASACVFLLELPDARYDALLATEAAARNEFVPPLVNVGVGADVTIAELAQMVKETIGYEGRIVWDRSKPDGTPRKLLDIGRMRALGWTARIPLKDGIRLAYQAFLSESTQT